MFTTSEIARVTGGKLLGGDVTVTGVSTDTRTIEPGMLFVAIRGESFDGNDYIGAAAEKGAAAAISDRAAGADGYSIPVILAEDSRAAQLALAHYHREKFPLKLVGVTGSVGKTSTKDMVYAGGDVVTGSATVILAMGAGKQAAKSIDEYIQSKK